ncbi:MAG: hypothetical protein U0804_13380 [Gemmataceae bacterium]
MHTSGLVLTLPGAPARRAGVPRPVVDALELAVARRRPGVGLLAHSDRGSQYASEHFRRVLAGAGIVCSMSGVGQCWETPRSRASSAG